MDIENNSYGYLYSDAEDIGMLDLVYGECRGCVGRLSERTVAGGDDL